MSSVATATSTATGRPPSLREWIRDHDESWIFVALYLGLAVGLSVMVSLFWLVVMAGLHFALELLRQRHYRKGTRSVVLHALWEVKLDVGLVLLALTLVLYIDVVLGILGIQSAARAAAVTRAGARVGARAAAWERNLRTFLLTVDEMLRIGNAGLTLGRKARKERREKRERERLERERLAAGAADGDDESSGTDTDGAPDAASDAASDDAPPTSGATSDVTPPTPGAPDPTEPAATFPLPDAWSGSWRTWRWGDRIGVTLVTISVLLITTAPLLTEHDWRSARVMLLEELHPFPPSSEEEGEEDEVGGATSMLGPAAELSTIPPIASRWTVEPDGPILARFTPDAPSREGKAPRRNTPTMTPTRSGG